MKEKKKRLLLAFLQHIIAACTMLAMAELLLNSYIKVDSIDGTKTYKLFPVVSKQEFEDSDIFSDLFRNTASDIIQYAAIKEQMETDGVFQPAKHIDVTKYASDIGVDRGCRVTAVYELDDLIKWGKFGVEYNNLSMSLSEFVNYFGYCTFPENFTLDEYGQLCFDDFYRLGEDSPDTGDSLLNNFGEVIGTVDYGKSLEEIREIQHEMEVSGYSYGQLEDMVLAHIVAQCLEELDISYEDDRIRIGVPVLSGRYAAVDGQKLLLKKVNNWVDLIRLQNNLVAAIQSLTLNYERYLECNRAYGEGNSNVRFVVRMTDEESVSTYTNIVGLAGDSDENITEVFTQYNRYLIYYPDSLVFMGNTVLNEKEIVENINTYDYIYPENTHIWIGVDTDYSVPTDTFYSAFVLYNKVVPNVGRLIALFVILFLGWFGLGSYLTITTRISEDENGKMHLNHIDHIWTEALLLLAAGFAYGGYRGTLEIINIAETAEAVSLNRFNGHFTGFLQYGIFALYGVYLSLAISIIWYSLVRRFKASILVQGSLSYLVFTKLGKVFGFILRHRNSMVSILLPYNFYLFANLAGVVAAYRYWEKKPIAFLALAVTIIFDGFVGVLLFRRNAEQNEIVDGINRIRSGEVDFVLEAESLHGTGRELAIAVNNIGEGIRKAVKTSMKDEQMKTDLITNVSHDIKTPLTSIINYVDLLKRLKITEEPAKGYIEILDTKSQRLKQLTDDLVEASKISSGNIILNMERINLTELLNQGIGEFSEKLEANDLQLIFESSDKPAYIYADSRRMWRIVENLLNNACKYAMQGTRVYVDVEVENGKVGATIKNISRYQMNIKPEELTERFIRGDSARSTEGSGLGLSIAQSLARAQGGEFEIYLDGDLFKVTISFPEYKEEGTDH